MTTVPLLLFAHAAPRVPLGTLGWLQYSVPTINLALGVARVRRGDAGVAIVGFALVWVGLALITVDALRNRGRAAVLDRRDPLLLRHRAVVSCRGARVE